MSNFPQIIHQYKTDTESVYNIWFVDDDQKLKAFRTIRRCVFQVIEDIKSKTFPSDLGAIAELCFESRTQKILLGPEEYLSEAETKYLNINRIGEALNWVENN